MSPRFRRPGRLTTFVWAALLAALPVLAAPAPAADLNQLDNSLKLVPADAAFYNTMLRNREQIEAVLKSKAWAKLVAMPVVQQGWKQLQDELDNPNSQVAFARAFMLLPENQMLLDLLLDMGSNEVFFYGGSSWENFSDLAMKSLSALQFGPALQMLQGFQPGLDPEALQARAVLQALDQNRDLIQAPDLVVGFKLTNNERADFQMKRLEVILNALVQQVPPLKGRLKKQNLAGGNFLVLELDGQLVPWREIPFEDFETKPGEFDKLKEKLRGLKLAVTIGVKDNYLLVSLGSSTEPITGLGKGKNLLSRPEFAKLAAHADQKLTSVSYVSKGLLDRFVTKSSDFKQLQDLANEGLKKAPLTDKQKDQIKKDLADLVKDVEPFLPKPGAMLAYSFMNDRGMESFSYDWSQGSDLDGTKPLTLLNHVGGEPIFAVVGRSQYKPEYYELMVKWAKIGYGYVEDIGVPLMPPDQRKQFQTFMQGVLPLLKRADEVNRTMLVPALKDGQAALVIDGKLTSRQWFLMQPAAEKPLPMVELGLAFGVSDAKLLEQGLGEYRSLINALIVQVQRVQPMQGGAFQIPAPKTQNLKDGTMYFYPLPPGLPFDAQLLPNGGLSKDVAVLSLSQAHTQRLLSKTPLKTDGGPLADLNKPRAIAVYFNWGTLVDAAAPWVEYAARFVILRGPGEDDKKAEEIMGQIRTVLSVLKVLRTVSSSTYFEGGVQVTHSEAVIRDLP